MTEKEKIDAAVKAAVKEAEDKAKADREEAVAKARQEAAEDAKAEAVELAKADADADRQKAIDEAVANAKAEAKAEADQRIESILKEANEAIGEARAQGADSAKRGGKTGKLKHYIVVAVSFIGGSLVAPGSRVNSDDLGTYRDPATGEERAVKPGETLVEVTEDGRPIDEAAAWKLQQVAGMVGDLPIAAVQPFSPNPTAAQGAPAQAPGGVSLAENQLRTGPAQGVESDEAAAARAEHADNAATAVQAMTAGEKPRRRSQG